jgi:hypothetical protein
MSSYPDSDEQKSVFASATQCKDSYSFTASPLTILLSGLEWSRGMATPDAACPAMLHALALSLSASGVDHDLFMALYSMIWN